MTVLTACQKAARRLREEVPTDIVGGTGVSASLYEALIEAAEELVTIHEWQALRAEHTWSATASEEQTSAFPSDFGRMCKDTFWNRSEQRQVCGPYTQQEWQQLKGTVSNAVFDQYTVRGDAMLIDPVPTAGETYAYAYVVNTPWFNGATPATAPDGDDYVFRLDEEMLVRNIVWRFRRDSGLDFQEDEANAMKRTVQQIAQERGGKQKMDLVGGGLKRPMHPGVVVQEGNWTV